MHTMIIAGPKGAEARVHHNSDWSGEAQIVAPGQTTVAVPGWVLKGLVAASHARVRELANEILDVSKVPEEE